MFRKLSLAEKILNADAGEPTNRHELSEFLVELIPEDASTADPNDLRGRLTMHLAGQIRGPASDVDHEFRNFRTLFQNAAQTIPSDQLPDFRDDLLFQQLLTLTRTLGPFADVIKPQLRSGDRMLVSRYVDLYLQMPAGGGQDELASLLLDAVHLPPNSHDSPENLAAAIRQQLRSVPIDRGADFDQWRQWQHRSQLVLNRPLADADDTEAIVSQTATLSLLAAIGEAIVELERNPAGNASAVLDELNGLGEFAPPAAPRAAFHVCQQTDVCRRSGSVQTTAL